MNIATGITTAPRPVSYIEGTIESVRAAGFSDPLVLHDDECSGPYRHFKRLLEILIDRTNAEAFAIFQDDVQVAVGLRDLLDRQGWPESPDQIGVVSLYTAKPHHLDRKGWHRLCLKFEDGQGESPELVEHVRSNLTTRGDAFPESGLSAFDEIRVMRRFAECTLIAARFGEAVRWFVAYESTDAQGRTWTDISETQHWAMAFGACALLIPRASAVRLLENCSHPEARSRTDGHLAETCFRLGLSWWMHTPSFVEHRGEVSSLHGHPITDYRRAGEFLQEVPS